MPTNKNEQILCGYHAVTAALDKRRDDLLRFFCTEERAREFPNTMKFLAAKRRIYRLVSDKELETICGTTAHQGVVAVFSRPEIATLTPDLASAWSSEARLIVVLDGIENPHNIGAIARSAAFFGAQTLLVSTKAPSLLWSTAAFRVAEGAMEHLSLLEAKDLPADLKMLKKCGYTLLGLDMRGSGDITSYAGKALNSPVALVIGAEETGLSANVRPNVRLTKINGHFEAIESLNASAAAAIGLSWLVTKGGQV